MYSIFQTKCFSDSREKQDSSQEKRDLSREKQYASREKRDEKWSLTFEWYCTRSLLFFFRMLFAEVCHPNL